MISRLTMTLLTATSLVSAASAAVLPATLPDTLQPAGVAHVSGRLGDQMNSCIHNGVAKQPLDELIVPFSERTDVSQWRSEFWGKWITSAIAAARYTNDPALRATVDEAVKRLIATQTPDGYIGAYDEKNRLQRWDVWGRKYTLLGLLDYHEFARDRASLAAAVRLADHLIKETGPDSGVNPFKNDRWNGMPTSSVMEPLVRLFRHTRDERYLDYCRYLIQRWELPGGPDLVRKIEQGVSVHDMFPKAIEQPKSYREGGYSKAYEMMSCYEGLLELYRDTGEARYREAALAVWKNIYDTEITVLGSGSDWERWNGGRTRQTKRWHEGMETCVTVYWMKLSAQLLALTGESRYADAFETSLYNALLGAMKTDGSWWSHYAVLDGARKAAEPSFNMHQHCCVANAPRAVMWIPGLAVMNRADGLAVNLYVPLTMDAKLRDGTPVHIEQTTRYPEEGVVSLRVKPSVTREFALAFRVPAWSPSVQFKLNGQPLPAEQAPKSENGYLVVTRTWAPGDTVELDIDLAPRVVAAPEDPARLAVVRGPVVLAHDSREGPPAALPAQPGPVALRPAESKLGAWMSFAVGEGTSSVLLVDYPSAADDWKPSSKVQVWLPRSE